MAAAMACREHLLAVLTDESLGLNWMPADPKVPAHVLSPADVDTLRARLRDLVCQPGVRRDHLQQRRFSCRGL